LPLASLPGMPAVAPGDALSLFWRSWPCREAAMVFALPIDRSISVLVPHGVGFARPAIAAEGITSWAQPSWQASWRAPRGLGHEMCYRAERLELLLHGEIVQIHALLQERQQAFLINLSGHRSPPQPMPGTAKVHELREGIHGVGGPWNATRARSGWHRHPGETSVCCDVVQSCRAASCRLLWGLKPLIPHRLQGAPMLAPACMRFRAMAAFPRPDRLSRHI